MLKWKTEEMKKKRKGMKSDFSFIGKQNRDLYFRVCVPVSTKFSSWVDNICPNDACGPKGNLYI